MAGSSVLRPTSCVALMLVWAFRLWAALAAPYKAEASKEDDLKAKYERWMARYGRSYGDEKEKEQRFRIYSANVGFIDQVNSLNYSYKLMDNQFADLSNEEFRARHLGYGSHAPKMPTPFVPSHCVHNAHVPDTIDWRTKGAVTPVKDQAECGSCWAFSTVAAIEGINQIKTGELVSLLEQELVDCDLTSSGCQGGWPDTAFECIKENGGIASEKDYPYAGIDSACNIVELGDHAATISGYRTVPAKNQTCLKAAAANQPISVAIDAAGMEFQFYASGIFDGPCGMQSNHAVTVVGYGREKESEFWIVKNSWGTTWGEHGYIRMKRNVAEKEGLCGIAMNAFYPTKEKYI
ncbi:hypothetical protein ACLOJK_010421 [Asimina triloba]